MSSRLSRRNFLTLGASSVAVMLVARGGAAFAITDEQHRVRGRSAIDVSCNANSIRFTGPQGPNPNDTNDLGPHPYYGASFIVQGTIYPAGTLASAGLTSGLHEDGSAEFPELVVGKWICRGWFIGDSNGDGFITPDDDNAKGGIFTPDGKFVATTQIYDLNPELPGGQTLVSDGVELINTDTPFRRAITGGTGSFSRAKGQVIQTAVGINATGLFNFEFDFEISPGHKLY